MAEETKATPAISPTTTAKKVWKYVGPGSQGHKDKVMPTIGNLPLDPKLPRLGTVPGVVAADDLTPEQIAYVMATNTAAATWWVQA